MRLKCDITIPVFFILGGILGIMIGVGIRQKDDFDLLREMTEKNRIGVERCVKDTQEVHALADSYIKECRQIRGGR